MKSKNRLSQKFALDRRYFFAMSLLAVGLFVLAWFYPESFPSKTSLLPRGIVMDQGDLLWSLFFLSSFITMITGLLFTSKNPLVWVVLVLLSAPHVFLLLIFTGLGEGSLFQSFVSAIRAYLFVVSLGLIGWYRVGTFDCYVYYLGIRWKPGSFFLFKASSDDNYMESRNENDCI